MRGGVVTMKTDLAKKLFTWVSIGAAIYTIIEMVMQSFGSSICATEGCKVVSSHTRFGDMSILVIGLGLFVTTAILNIQDVRLLNGRYGNIIDILLIAGLSAEGFFTGYQAFHIKTPCIFCLSIFGLVLLLSILRLMSGEKAVLAGFVSFAVVFVFLYLVLPAGAGRQLPRDAGLILFYSEDCRHCAEIKKKMDEAGIKAEHLKAGEYADFLKAAGIEHVPTLLVNEPYRKLFLTGEETIECFLFDKDDRKGASVQKYKRSDRKAESMNMLEGPLQIFTPSGDPGVCSEDVKQEECK